MESTVKKKLTTYSRSPGSEIKETRHQTRTDHRTKTGNDKKYIFIKLQYVEKNIKYISKKKQKTC